MYKTVEFKVVHSKIADISWIPSLMGLVKGMALLVCWQGRNAGKGNIQVVGLDYTELYHLFNHRINHLLEHHFPIHRAERGVRSLKYKRRGDKF
jgi:hypothetical protein